MWTCRLTRLLRRIDDPRAGCRFQSGDREEWAWALEQSGSITARKPRDHEPGAFAPSAAGLAALLAEMVERRCKGGVLEVASEALAHRSFEGIAFHAAVVTDVAAPLGFPPEVLLQKRRAKAKLVRQVVPGGVVVVNADDPNARGPGWSQPRDAHGSPSLSSRRPRREEPLT